MVFITRNEKRDNGMKDATAIYKFQKEAVSVTNSSNIMSNISDIGRNTNTAAPQLSKV
jgi:hypothetical protein